MEKQCSKCGVSFTCQNEADGCWCQQIELKKETLATLKRSYENCLCLPCLQSFENKKQNKTPGNNISSSTY